MDLDEAKGIAQLRNLRKKLAFDTVVSEHNVAVVAEAVGSEEELVEEAHKELKRLGTRPKPHMPRPTPAPKPAPAPPAQAEPVAIASGASGSGLAAAEPAPPPPAPAAVARIEIPMKMYTLEEARTWMPVSKGCSLAINKDTAWEGKYRQRPVAFRSRSRCFEAGDEASSFASLREVLAWCWQVHHECTGAASPYDLGELIC